MHISQPCYPHYFDIVAAGFASCMLYRVPRNRYLTLLPYSRAMSAHTKILLKEVLKIDLPTFSALTGSC